MTITRRKVECSILICLACPHCERADGVRYTMDGWVCGKMERPLPDSGDIPEWCPLPVEEFKVEDEDE